MAEPMSLLTPEQQQLLAAALAGESLPMPQHPASMLNPMQQELVAPFLNQQAPVPPELTPSPPDEGSQWGKGDFWDKLPPKFQDLLAAMLKTGKFGEKIFPERRDIQWP